MSKVMKVDASAADAWARKTLSSPQTDMWVTCRIAIPGSSMTAMRGQPMVWIFDNTGFPPTGSPVDYIQTGFPADDNWATSWDGSALNAVANIWHTCELHHVILGASQLYVDGALEVDAIAGVDSTDMRLVMAGVPGAAIVSDSVYYIADFKVGTTRGAEDLFADDFESEDFSAWTSTSGDVSVVDDPFPSVAPTQGTVRVLVAFTDDTLTESPDFTDLADPSGYRLGTNFTISRGRQSELEKTGTGTATIIFNDSIGVLDPTNTAGPFYGNLDPMKQVALELWNPITETFSRLFRGYKTDPEDDLQMWSDSRGLDTVTWEAADAFDLFASMTLTPNVDGDSVLLADFPDVYYAGTPANLPGESDVFIHVDDRIMQILDDAGWPNTGARNGLRDIFSGNVSVQGKVYDRGDAFLAALFDAADAEFPGVANVYMSKTGVVSFRGRFARFFPTNPDYGIQTWKVGGVAEALADPTVAAIAGSLRFRNAKTDIINTAIAVPLNPADIDVALNTVEDATSIAKYGRRQETFEDLLTSAGHDDAGDPTTAQVETRKFAEYYVGNYKDAKTRISRIGFRSRSPDDPVAPALWDLLCNIEIGDRIYLTTVHTGGTASGFNEYGYVEGLHYEVEGAQAGYADVSLTLDVSPASFYEYNPFGTADSGTAGTA